MESSYAFAGATTVEILGHRGGRVPDRNVVSFRNTFTLYPFNGDRLRP